MVGAEPEVDQSEGTDSTGDAEFLIGLELAEGVDGFLIPDA